MLPPEFYLNLQTLEKNYIDKDYGVNYNIPVSRVRMYISRRFAIKHDLVHLNSMSKWLGVPQVQLIRKRYKPEQNKLLTRVKKRLRMRKKKMNVFVRTRAKPKTLSAPEAMKLPSHGPNREEKMKRFIKEEDALSPKTNDDDEGSMMSTAEDHPRVSILDII